MQNFEYLDEAIEAAIGQGAHGISVGGNRPRPDWWFYLHRKSSEACVLHLKDDVWMLHDWQPCNTKATPLKNSIPATVAEIWVEWKIALIHLGECQQEALGYCPAKSWNVEASRWFRPDPTTWNTWELGSASAIVQALKRGNYASLKLTYYPDEKQKWSRYVAIGLHNRAFSGCTLDYARVLAVRAMAGRDLGEIRLEQGNEILFRAVCGERLSEQIHDGSGVSLYRRGEDNRLVVYFKSKPTKFLQERLRSIGLSRKNGSEAKTWHQPYSDDAWCRVCWVLGVRWASNYR